MANLVWIESPETVGLRFVGLAHDVGKAGHAYLRDAVTHSGWYLESEFQDETVSGVVYQVSGKGRRARYVVGYADPFNTDSQGRGPACLDLGRIILGDVRDSDWESCSGARDAARAADSHAESMAERERDYQDAWRMGGRYGAALEAARAARRECLALLATIKGNRDKAAPFCGVLRGAVSDLVTTWQDEKEKAARLWADRPTWDDLESAFLEGAEI